VGGFQHGFEAGMAMALGSIFLIAGAVLIVTMLFWFIGVPLVLFSGYPLYRVEKRYLNQRFYRNPRGLVRR
jgi:hypothetical protein